MKRVLILIGGIIGTVASSVIMVLMLIGIVNYLQVLEMSVTYLDTSIPITTLLIIFLIITLVLLTLLFSICSIPVWKQLSATFARSKGIVIASTIFDFLLAIVCCLVGTVFYVIMGIFLFASAILYIIDIATESEKIEHTSPKFDQDENQFEDMTNVQPIVENVSDDIEEKIIKLNEMKENGIITKDEYRELKKSYIERILTNK